MRCVVLAALVVLAPSAALADTKVFAFPVGHGYLRLTSSFGTRWGEPHRGTDFEARRLTTVHAAAAGLVVKEGWDRRCGWFVKLRHAEGWETVYCHLHSRARKSHGVRVGQIVRLAEPIGWVGSTGRSTGPHLHFGVKRWGRFVDPVRFTLTPKETLRLLGDVWSGARMREERSS